MPVFNLPETVQIPFDALSNEQRAAIHTVMSGDGLINPLSEKIQKCREAIRHEMSIFNGFQLAVADDGGGCVECPISGCPTLIGQQRVEIMYQLELLLYWLDVLELHTDKLSGSSVEYIDNFFQRLSTAGAFSSAMKSITGQNTEKFSYVFHSLMGSGDNCLDRILNDFWGDCIEGPSFCGNISVTSGVVGLAQGVCTSDVAQCVISSFLPSLIQCIKDLIDEDDLNYCEAKKIVDKYAAAQRLTTDTINDPIMGAIVKSLFATPALSDALRQIQDEEFSDEFTQSTAEFFPEFTDETGRIADCEGAPLVAVGPPGEKGDPGLDGCKGPQGLPGAPGVDGECYDPDSPCGGTQGACCVNGFCLEVTQNQCAFYNGNYYGDNYPCEDTTEDCFPTGCGNDSECPEGQVCCGGSCVTPCQWGAANSNLVYDENGQLDEDASTIYTCSNCPPCSQCSDCTNGCGGNCDCGEGNICCNDLCVAACPNGDCPNCQGGCCPPNFSCCGGDGCCADGFCLNGSCCDGAIVCGDTCCQDSGNGLGCCGNNCPCSIGDVCCGDTCVDEGNGQGCCPTNVEGNFAPCAVGQTCCSTGCEDDCTTCAGADPCDGCPEYCCPPSTPCSWDETVCCDSSVEYCCGQGCCDLGQQCCGMAPAFGTHCCPAGSLCCGTENCCSGATPCCNAITGECESFCEGTTQCPSPGDCGGGCGCGQFPGCDASAVCQIECDTTTNQCCTEEQPYFVNGECVAPCPSRTCCEGINPCPLKPIPNQTGCDECPCCPGDVCCGGVDCCQEGFCFNDNACLESYCPETCDGSSLPWKETNCLGESPATGFPDCCEASGGLCADTACKPFSSCPFCEDTGDSCQTSGTCSCFWGGDERGTTYIIGNRYCNGYVDTPEIVFDGCCPEGMVPHSPQKVHRVPLISTYPCEDCGEQHCQVGDDTCDRSSLITSPTAGENKGPGTVYCCEPWHVPGNGCCSPYDEICQREQDSPFGITECDCICCDKQLEPSEWPADGRFNALNAPFVPHTKIIQINGGPTGCPAACAEECGCVPREDATGACCVNALRCLDGKTLQECLDEGATESEWFDGQQCSDSSVVCLSEDDEPCNTDSDCYNDATCCDFGGGDKRCTQSSCPTPFKCCFERPDHPEDYPYCEEHPRDYCLNILGGEFFPGEECEKNELGANGEDLCVPEFFCEVAEDCDDYDPCRFHGCECENGRCQQIGSCCFGSGLCEARTKADCTTLFGTFNYDPSGVCKGCTDDNEDGQYLCYSLENSYLDEGPYTTTSCDCTLGVCCVENTTEPMGPSRYECIVSDDLVTGITRSRCSQIVAESNGELQLLAWKTCQTGNDCPETCQPLQGCCLGSECLEDIPPSNCASPVWGGCTDPGEDSADCYVPPEDWCCCCNANCEEYGCGAQEVDGNGNCPACCQKVSGVEFPAGGVGSDCDYAPAQCDCETYSGDIDCGCPEIACCLKVRQNYGEGCQRTTEGQCAAQTNRLANVNAECGDDDSCPRGACCKDGECLDGYLKKWCEENDGIWVENTTGEADFCAAVNPCDDGPGTDGCGDFPRDGNNCGACCHPCQTQGGGGTCTTPDPCFIGTPEECEALDWEHFPGLSCGEAGCNIIISDPGHWCCCRPGEQGIACNCVTGGSGENPCQYGGRYKLGPCPSGSTCACPQCCTEESPCAGANETRNLFTGRDKDDSTTIPEGPSRAISQPNLPLSPCPREREFCVDSDGIGKCCEEGKVCFNGDCVDQPSRNKIVVGYSSVRKEYFYCPEGFCNTLDINGRAVCKNATSSNCPELQKRSGNSRLIAINKNITSIDRTYSAYQTFTRNKDVILQSNFDKEGRLENYFIVVNDRPVVGRQNELLNTFTIGAVTTQKEKEQQIVTAPIKFQIINYVADDKIKQSDRPANKTRGATDTKSKISKAELRDSKDVGLPGAQVNGVSAQTIDGSLTAIIDSSGIIADSQVITFVSGSNIRLDSNEDTSIIRISVDDLHLWELVDVDDGVSGASNNDVLQYDSSDGLWKAVALSVGVTGATGPVGPVGGADGQILFNDSGGASGNSLLTFNDATTTLTVGTGVTTNVLGGMSAGGASDFNDNIVNEAKLVDYSEKVNAIGTISSSPYVINIENGNVQTFTAGGDFTAAFLNPPASGAAGSLTLIITNGGAHTITWPTSVKWSSGVAPTLTSSGTDILSFTTIDGGTNWYGFVGGLGFA